MTLSEQQQLFAQHVAQLIIEIKNQGYACTLAEAYRTSEQAALYAKRGVGIIDSLHCERLAIDLNLFKNGEYLMDNNSYEIFGKWWESLDPNNRWGGYFVSKYGGHIVDLDHFERKPE
jgi:hypothetical protein